ncbi:MAG: PhoH family protein [Candidatus Zixiibacteriota bacterium]|nr:MAG: PhoH family protein [candidate division Zixibacteria bacterium]
MELTLTLENLEKRVQLFGTADDNLRIVREICDVRITARDGRIKLSGTKDAVAKAAALLESMQEHLKKIDVITKKDMLRLLDKAVATSMQDKTHQIEVYIQGRAIEARTAGQERYIGAIEKNDMVFCTGPAGTGKTYLAVAMAVSMLKGDKIRRIILARPAVEAGEKLGFLPGDMQAKVNPYLRPLFDALGDMMKYDQVKQFMQNDIIEVVPLAFMRGRTLNSAVVILDEAQNTTRSQMLMFLTRLGHDSKMIVTGDDSQTDLEDGQTSGLIDAMVRLKDIKGIAFIRLTDADIVRHRLVQNIVKAYEENKSKRVDE